MMAACENVETYAAAQVFYSIGYGGIDYCLDVFISDTSSLKWRGLMYAFSTTPFLATTFAGPEIGERFLFGSEANARNFVLGGPGWRWGFGAFAIIVPVVCSPVAMIFWVNRRKAIQTGLLKKKEPSGRTFIQSVRHNFAPSTMYRTIKYYFIEFDVIGLILITGGFAMFLLPFNLAVASQDRWNDADIIALIVVGGVCLIAFVIYQAKFSPKPFIPFRLLRDRQVLGACILGGTLFVSFYCWDGYWYSYLIVVFNLSFRDAGYANSTYTLGSCAFAVPIGFLIAKFGYVKRFALAGIPLMILGVGLMIHFRDAGQGVGYAIMAQVFIALAGGILVISEQIAVLAAGAQENVATLLALLSLFTFLGGAVGNTISAAIWRNTLPEQLSSRLTNQTLATEVFQNYAAALNWPIGTPERTAIVESYAHAQRLMAIAGTAVLAIGVIAIFMWRDFDVRKVKQVKGRVI